MNPNKYKLSTYKCVRFPEIHETHIAQNKSLYGGSWLYCYFRVEGRRVDFLVQDYENIARHYIGSRAKEIIDKMRKAAQDLA